MVDLGMISGLVISPSFFYTLNKTFNKNNGQFLKKFEQNFKTE